MDAFVESIKQHPGQQQVDRAVKVNVPGKHFPGLTPSEQKQDYEGTAVEYRERYKFEKHLKAWGVAGTFPGIRFICRADAIDDRTPTTRASGRLLDDAQPLESLASRHVQEQPVEAWLLSKIIR